MCRPKKGRWHRPVARRPRPAWLETPRSLRRVRDPARRHHHRRQRPRHQSRTRPGRSHRPVAGRVGRPRRRPDTILADGAYDSIAFREWLHTKRIAAVIPQRGRKKIIGLGRIRWVVEQTIAHLHQFKRFAVRGERHLFMHQGFVTLAAALICWRRLTAAP